MKFITKLKTIYRNYKFGIIIRAISKIKHKEQKQYATLIQANPKESKNLKYKILLKNSLYRIATSAVLMQNILDKIEEGDK